MRRLFIFPILMLSVQLNAQNIGDIFDQTKANIVWLGVDFSKAIYVGEVGTVSNEEFKPLFDKINLFIVTESQDFNFRKSLRKPEVPYDLSHVNSINAQIDADKIVPDASSFQKSHFSEELVSGLVQEYDVDLPEYIGLVFFMETIDKTSETATMWVTFFTLSDHKVLLTEKMVGKAGGFGFRNHWAETVRNVLKKINSTRYNEWKRK